MQFLDPKIDIAFKKLFGSEDHKRVTISFLNAILEYTGDRKIKSIQFLNTEQLPTNPDKKENILDIHCTDEAHRTFIIEMQNAWMTACNNLSTFTKKEYELVTDKDKWLFLLNNIGSYDHIPKSLQHGEFKEACIV